MYLEFWTGNYDLKSGDEISITNSDFQYDTGYNTFSNAEKPYWYKVDVTQVRETHDEITATNQGGSSGNYSYQYFKVMDILAQGQVSEDEEGEELYICTVHHWRNIYELPPEVGDNYCYDFSEFDGTIKKLTVPSFLELDEFERADVIDESFWRYTIEAGNHMWERYSPESVFDGYFYPDEVHLEDVLAVRVKKDNKNLLYINKERIGDRTCY